MSRRLANKTAIVLGASAAGGSGWRIAERFAQEGAHVFVAARRLEGLETLASRIGGTAMRCDATIDDDVAELAKMAADRSGTIDAAVFAAGKAVPGSIANSTGRQIERALRVNLFGAFAFIREICPLMPAGSAATLMSSLSSTNVYPGLALYGVAKAALNALVRYAAIEFAPSGVRVNGIVPGLIETPMAEQLLSYARDAVTHEIPLGQPVQPEEIAAMCLYLALDARSMTGALIPVDGGNHLRRPPFPEEMPVRPNQ